MGPTLVRAERVRDRPWLGCLAVAAVAAFGVTEAVRIVVQRAHVVLYGDQALLELGARRAAQFDQLVGPYSREGFHHPGPVVFYALAPFVRVLEPWGPGLYLGAVTLNVVVLSATVAVLWRCSGPLVALWAAAAIDLYSLCLGVGTLREPWNPYLIVAPMVLFVVLWAAAMAGSYGAGVWSLVVGSFEVQTHIATAGFVATMSAILVVTGVRRARRPRPVGSRRRHRWTPAEFSGVVGLALVWTAPVVELWRDRPNNVQLLWEFFTAPHARPALRQALKASANAWTIMPFGYHDYVLTFSRTTTEIGVGATLIVVLFAVTVTVGWRRRQPLSLALVASSLLGVALGTISLALTPGPVYFYFAVWLAFAPLSLVLGLGVALLAPGERHATLGGPWAQRDRPRAQRDRPRASVAQSRPLVVGCVVAAVTTAALSVYSDLSMGPVNTTTGSGPWPPGNAATAQGKVRTVEDTAALARAAHLVLGPTDRWVNITIGTASLWPYVAGMVLDLDRHGVQSTVSPATWTLYFGHERAPWGAVTAVFDLYSSSDVAAKGAAKGAIISDVHGEVLTYQRLPG